jgi:hypothetical protein
MEPIDPHNLFLSAYDNFPAEFVEHWGLDSDVAPEHLDPDEWEEFRALDRLAQRLQPIAATLARPRQFPETELKRPYELLEADLTSRKFISEILDRVKNEHGTDSDLWRALISLEPVESRRYEFFLCSLQLHVVPPFLVWPRNVAERLVRLTRYVPRVRSDLALQYLSRVSLCYLRDMAPELAVMARAVLGSLLEGALELDTLRAERGIRPGARIGLEALIEEARRQNWLTRDALSAAKKVKQLGDDAAHVAPQLVGSCDEVLEQLVIVLAELEAGEVL